MKLRNVVVVLSTVAMSANVMGAGFEKVVQWSARWSGVAGAATGAVGGADSLYFNPAGLGKFQGDNQVSGNLTQTQSEFDGPIAQDNVEIRSIKKTTTLPALLYARKLSDNFTIGAGAYVAGGTGASFGPVEFSGATSLTPDVSTQIQLFEYALGASFQFSPELSVGAAVRFAEADGYFNGGANGAALRYTGLEDDATGFRAGIMYDKKDWGLGFNYRSEISLKLEGDARVQIDGGASVASGGILGDVTMENDFPFQWSLGGFYQINKKLRAYAEIVFTEYSTNDRLNVNVTTKETFGSTAVQGNAEAAVSNVEQEWDDQWNYKLGAEYVDGTLSYRAGYALTSQVTPDRRARATFASPGQGHTLVGGLGKHWDGTHFLDGAIEYSWAEGKNSDNSFVPLGDYSTNALSFHTSYTVSF